MKFQKKKIFQDQGTGSSAQLYHTGGHHWLLTHVFTPKEQRGLGGAHRILKQVTDCLDQMGAFCGLEVRHYDEGGLSDEQLVVLYASHGFVLVDHEEWIVMIRSPLSED